MLTGNSVNPIYEFQNVFIRTDKSSLDVTNQVPWNWSIGSGERLAVLTSNAFLRYQLIAVLAGLVPAVAGRQLRNGVISWPLGGEGGLDSKLKIRYNVEFVCELYQDRLRPDQFSLEEFWTLLAGHGIKSQNVLRELSSFQKSMFFIALSLLFSFDLHLVPQKQFLMSRAARSLRNMFLKQSQNSAVLTTSTNARFLRQCCNRGLVLSPYGEPLFFGGLDEALTRFNQNLNQVENDDPEDSLMQEINLQNSDRETDIQDEIL